MPSLTTALPKIFKPDCEWRAQLMHQQHDLTRQHGTEHAFTRLHGDEKREGEYCCICCGASLFSSAGEYDAGSGWPSFCVPLNAAAVSEHEERSSLRRQIEARRARCGAHLDHVFRGGPKPTGLRPCMTGSALSFGPASAQKSASWLAFT